MLPEFSLYFPVPCKKEKNIDLPLRANTSKTGAEKHNTQMHCFRGNEPDTQLFVYSCAYSFFYLTKLNSHSSCPGPFLSIKTLLLGGCHCHNDFASS